MPPSYPVGDNGDEVPFDYLPQSQQAAIALAAQGQSAGQDLGPGPGNVSPGQPPAWMQGMTPQADQALTNAEVPGARAASGAGNVAADIVAPNQPQTVSAPSEPAHFQNAADLDWGGQQSPAPSPSVATPPPSAGGGGGVGGSNIQAQAQEGMNTQIGAAYDAADVAAQKGKAEQDILASGLDTQQKLAQWQTLHANEMQQYVADHTAKMQSMMEDFRNNSKVNPNKYWDDMGVAGKATSAMALILGGIGSGLTGQKNAAQEVIDGAIKRNVDAQVQNIKTKHDAIEDESNMVGQYMKNGMDINQAKAAASATQRAMIGDQLLSNSAGFAGPAAKANAEKAIGEGQVGFAKDIDEFKTHSLQRAAEAQTMKFNALNEGYALQGRQAVTNALYGGRIDASNPALAPYLVTLPDGSKTVAPRPEDAQKGRDIVTAGSNYMNSLQRVAEATQKASSFSLPGTEANAANKELEDALAQSKAAAHGYFKIKAGGKEGAGGEEGGAPESILDQLAGKGPVNPIQKAQTVARIKKLHDDTFEDIKDQLRANNVRIAPKVDTSKRVPVGG